MIWLSVPLGLAAWGLPLWAGKRNLSHKGWWALASGLACVLALFNGLVELMRRARNADQSALMEITGDLAVCCILLVLGTAIALFWMHAHSSTSARRWWELFEYVCICVLAIRLVEIAVRRSGMDFQKGEYTLVEQEFPLIATIGFGLITVLFLLFLFAAYRNRKPKSGIGGFTLQWLFTLAAFSQFLRALSVSRAEVGAMYTERVSWCFGLAGLFWGASILCMIVGIWDLIYAGAPKRS